MENIKDQREFETKKLEKILSQVNDVHFQEDLGEQNSHSESRKLFEQGATHLEETNEESLEEAPLATEGVE